MWTEADEHDFQMKLKDKELLELAAKAAGIEYVIHNELFLVDVDEMGHTVWNPLKDDCDAFRLAVRLKIDIGFDSSGKLTSSYCDVMNDRLIELHNDDPYAATRRAIVRAAAEIGKGMA
jgi:hypothetical protein